MKLLHAAARVPVKTALCSFLVLSSVVHSSLAEAQAERVPVCRQREITPQILAPPLNFLPFPGHFTFKRVDARGQTFAGFGHTGYDPNGVVQVFDFTLSFENRTRGRSPADVFPGVAGQNLRFPFMGDRAATVRASQPGRVVLDTSFGVVVLQDGQVPTTNGQPWTNTCDAGVFNDPAIHAFPGFGVFCIPGAIPMMVDCTQRRHNLPGWMRIFLP